MSLMTPDVSAITLGSTETMIPEAGFQAPSAGAGAQFGEVLAGLQPVADVSTIESGQAFAGQPLPAVHVKWAPALKVQALGEHLQLITPGAEPGPDISLEAFARAQGLDEVTISWLLGQGPQAVAPASGNTTGGMAWAHGPAMAADQWTHPTIARMTPAMLIQGQPPASVASALTCEQPPALAAAALPPGGILVSTAATPATGQPVEAAPEMLARMQPLAAMSEVPANGQPPASPAAASPTGQPLVSSAPLLATGQPLAAVEAGAMMSPNLQLPASTAAALHPFQLPVSAATVPGPGKPLIATAAVSDHGQPPASAAAGMVYKHPPAWAEGVLIPAPALPGAPATGVDGLNRVLQDPSADGIGPEASSAKPPATVPGLISIEASLAGLWGPGAAQGIGSPRSAAQAEQPTIEPTESLMATLRLPGATALAKLQRQLQNPALAPPADSKSSANLRVSDLDLSQSLATEGLELQNLLDDWSARLDGPSAGETQQNSALAAARGTGVMANSPLGIAPQGSAPQLGIDLADKFEQLAEKMGQAVAQRMLSEIEKGHWHLKLMLRPATLGHIEVEMRMRSGELDASFVASQNLTRELLQESLPRLRETLTQLGMDVANMNVDSGHSQRGDGEPTPRASAAQTRTGTPSGSAEMSTITAPHQERRGQEGWDVMV